MSAPLPPIHPGGASIDFERLCFADIVTRLARRRDGKIY